VAAVWVDTGWDATEAVDILDVLVARSMLSAAREGIRTRYRMLETLRQFAQQLAQKSQEWDEAQARHAAYFVTVAREARRDLATVQAGPAMERFAIEWDNLRAAFEWCAGHGDTAGALGLVSAACWPSIATFRYELLSWADQAVGLPGAPDDPLWPAALGAVGVLHWGVGDPVRAEREGARARDYEREQILSPHLDPIFAEAFGQWSSGRVDEAVDNFDEARRLADVIGDPMEVGLARYCQVTVDCLVRPSEARVRAEEAVRIAEASGNPLLLTLAYGGVVMYAAHVAKDKALARRAYELTRSWFEKSHNVQVLDSATAWMAGALGDDSAEALMLLHRAISDLDGVGDWSVQMMVLQVAVPALVRQGEPRLAVKVLGGVHYGGSTSPTSSEQ
jgi:hypothetical protein